MLDPSHAEWNGVDRIKKGAELAAWRHGYQAGELTVASLCPYSTGSILAKAWHQGYQKARDERRAAHVLKVRGTNDHG